MQEHTAPEVIQMDMNWQACVPMLFVTVANGNTAGMKAAREEMLRMAKAADQWNAHAVKMQALVHAVRTLQTCDLSVLPGDVVKQLTEAANALKGSPFMGA